MKRRSFLQAAVVGLPLGALAQAAPGADARRVAFRDDRFGEHRGLGGGPLDFKVGSQDAGGGILILEHSNLEKGGPPRHLHYDQEEWFYALEGEFVVEVGSERFRLTPGDSLLAPRKVPHAWASVGTQPGRILIAMCPAGKMEAFLRELTAGRTPSFADFGMEAAGPPLSVK